MRARWPYLLISLLLAFLPILALKVAGAANFPSARPDSLGGFPVSTSMSPNMMKTVDLPLPEETIVLDPALVDWSAASTAVVDQLFLGLVRADEESGEPLPQLASSWTTSGESTVFTFTLRPGLTWSDGNALTAEDVRYGILRALNPGTGSNMAQLLFDIVNAAQYNQGSITDSNLVGVKVLTPSILRFELHQPASYFPTILAMTASRPVPSWAINIHGESWTDPANIVTSGPYLLDSWVPSSTLTLLKNDAYYDVANVQIDEVHFRHLTQDSAWTEFKNGNLHSSSVPVAEWHSAVNDPSLADSLKIVDIDCTNYFGFNTSKEPFDDALVRRAFAAAIDRQAMIDEVFTYPQQPALTYVPPNVFGHVDGTTAGIGVTYDLTASLQMLAAAGYANTGDLPPIALVYNTNTGNQAMAENLRQQWIDHIGVTIAYSDLEWGDFLDLIATDPPQIFRLGWCSDYPDALNFYNGLISDRFGGWSNPTYESLLTQARRTPDPGARKFLYAQIEEILVETDAIMMPTHYHATGWATIPDLERTYDAGGYGGFIADWRLSQITNVYLPAIDSSWCNGYPGPGEIENNDSEVSATGPLCFGTFYTGNSNNDSPLAEEDWYYFDWSGQGQLTIRLNNFVPGEWLLLYFDSPDERLSLHNSPSSTYEITYTGDGRAGRYYIRIFASEGHPPGGDYHFNLTLK